MPHEKINMVVHWFRNKTIRDTLTSNGSIIIIIKEPNIERFALRTKLLNVYKEQRGIVFNQIKASMEQFDRLQPPIDPPWYSALT